jgi:hypothetical protein
LSLRLGFFGTKKLYCAFSLQFYDGLIACWNKPNVSQVKKSIKFHDVQESLNVFIGYTYSIIKLIENLEEMSEVCVWSDVELFIHSKRLMSGTAALYLRSENGIKSWNQLR